MKILMQKRKKGIYSSWYTIEGVDLLGDKIIYNIYPSQARCYPQAVRYFKGKLNSIGVKPTILRNSEPLTTSYFC
jgi:hypothetical protein